MSQSRDQAIIDLAAHLSTLSTSTASDTATFVERTLLRAEHKARLCGQIFFADVTHEIYVLSKDNHRLSSVIRNAFQGTSTDEEEHVLRKVFEEAKEVVKMAAKLESCVLSEQ